MKKYIVRYLTENYYLDKSQIGNAGIYSLDDNREIKPPVNANILINEIVTLFNYPFTRTRWLIHYWVKKQKPDYSLDFYWKSHGIGGSLIILMTNPKDDIIIKWQTSGFLDNIDGSKQSIAALYKSQAKQLL
jgi:hypothetical protein